MSSRVMMAVSAWRSLRLGGQEEAGISIPTIPSGVETLDGKVRHALGPAGEPRILLPVGMHERLPVFKESTALLVADVTFEKDGRPIRFIDMMCRVSELESVFSEVVEELLKRIREGERCRDAVGGTLADFRSLLVAPFSQEVSDSKIIGLIGELIALCRLLEINPDGWETWRGPAGERHDFRRNCHSLEVKTTARQSDSTVSISSIDQLDVPAGGTLHLELIVLERAVDAPITVSSMWSQVIELASQPEKVRDSLAHIGCDNPYSSAWNRLAFNLEREGTYQVIDGFPRISASSFKGARVPQGVQSLQYAIDLADAAEFELSKEAVSELLLRIAG